MSAVEQHKKLLSAYREYQNNLQNIFDMQSCLSSQVSELKKELKGNSEIGSVDLLSIKSDIKLIKSSLPQFPSGFSSLFFGRKLPITIYNYKEKIAFKKSYEHFKSLLCSIIATCLVTGILLKRYSPDKFSFVSTHFQRPLLALILYYYLTISLREAILYQNGSRIKEWWKIHHFASLTVFTLFLIYPAESGLQRHTNIILHLGASLFITQLILTRYQLKRLAVRARLRSEEALNVTTSEAPSVSKESNYIWLLPLLFFNQAFQVYAGWIFLTDHEFFGTVCVGLVCAALGFGNFYTTLCAVNTKFTTKAKLQ